MEYWKNGIWEYWNIAVEYNSSLVLFILTKVYNSLNEVNSQIRQCVKFEN